MIRKESFAN